MCPFHTRLHNSCTIVRVWLCCFHRSRAIFQTQVSREVHTRYNRLFYCTCNSKPTEYGCGVEMPHLASTTSKLNRRRTTSQGIGLYRRRENVDLVARS